MRDNNIVWEEKAKKQNPLRVVGGWRLSQKKSEIIVKNMLKFLLKNINFKKGNYC